MGSVEVYILGQKYTIKGGEPDEYIIELAKYVDSKLQEVFSKSPNMPPIKATILASLDIANDLHKLKNERELVSLKDIEEKTETLSNIFE